VIDLAQEQYAAVRRPHAARKSSLRLHAVDR
jgi:hypothetical protein